MNTQGTINISSAADVVDARFFALHTWLRDTLSSPIDVTALAGDASFRRYFRVHCGAQSFVVMDAPPDQENCTPFCAISKTFEHSSLRFPKIIASDTALGFLLLTDFGDRQLLTALSANTAPVLYGSAMDALWSMQQCREVVNYDLPHFDAALYWREFEIFFTWYLQKHLQKNISTQDAHILKTLYQLLIDSASQQPIVFVHRDYHSRNIMLCTDHQPAILDFQDAVWGPMTYDLVSLLRDCYIAWPEQQVRDWAQSFYQKWQSTEISFVDFSQFLRWFDWMGLQRHLKCLGIFSRLHYRDHKNNYLKEIPRVLEYVTTICDRYAELSVLKKWIVA